ncbi:hypothetical protein [Enterococcus sp. DIV0187]|uniref:hypothetical protein n=1 Tax=Enterococcus sp. DIV0187 TaxID=2774644 RepID=UPI003F685C17
MRFFRDTSIFNTKERDLDMLMMNETSKMQLLIQQTIDHFTPILWCMRLFLQTHRKSTEWEDVLINIEYLTVQNRYDVDDIVDNIKTNYLRFHDTDDYYIDLATDV